MDYSNLCFGCMEEKGAAQICSHCGYEEETGPESLLHLTPGIILQGKYMLGRVLGQGGYGITYLAWDLTLNIKLAVKEYLPQQLATRSAGQNTVTVYKSSLAEGFHYGLNKFLEEARTLARFNEHPNIVTVRDYFEANNTAYLVMNYHEGITLQGYLESKGGKIPVEQALAIFMPVLDALKEVHAAGILHRDISPDNLLIDKSGRVILIDFGAARQAIGEKSKSLSVIMKAGYSPPEQYQSNGKQGSWTDIYAVAASFYRSITGQAPLEAIDRLDEDDLLVPLKIGTAFDAKQEKILFKALAVQVKDRYKTVDQFQSELIAASNKGRSVESHAGVKPQKPVEVVEAEDKSREEAKEKAWAGAMIEAAGTPEKKLRPAQEPAGWVPKPEPSYAVNKRVVKVASVSIICGLLIIGPLIFFGGVDDTDGTTGPGAEETGQGITAEKLLQTFEPGVIAALDADYYIDYENGTIPIGDLPIGARVADPSWEWEYRLGVDYSNSDFDGDPTQLVEVKPVTWIVVVKDHYDGLEPHVTLLSEDLIALYTFDNSTGRGHEYDENGYNHWGDSGTANAMRGLRPWLNSTDIHAGEGFYQVFSDRFKQAVLITTLPNREWQNGNAYSTKDRVFLPSSTELGDGEHTWTYRIGDVYAYFSDVEDEERIAMIVGDGWYEIVEEVWGEDFIEDRRIYGNNWFYWTRSPASDGGDIVRYVHFAGEFHRDIASYDFGGVRPALNLKSGILVSEIRN